MGCPDAATGGGAGKRQPRRPHAALRGQSAVKQADRDQARDKADETGKHDESQIMLAAETGQNAEHYSTTSPDPLQDS